MIISHIVAVSKNFVIGKENRLPWKMPMDARYFHKVTEGHIVIMGRKNYQANGKALRNRTNIVITRKKDFCPPDVITATSIKEALSIASEYHPEEVFIIGGGEIYRQTLQMAHRIYITVIESDIEGDVHYPLIRFSDYHLISKIEKKSDPDNPFDHTYYILEK